MLGTILQIALAADRLELLGPLLLDQVKDHIGVRPPDASI